MLDELNPEFESYVWSVLIPKIDENNVHIGSFLSNFMYDSQYSPDGRILVVACGEEAHVIDKAGRLNFSLKDHESNICSIAFSPDGDKLATCSQDNTIIVYNVQDFSIACRLNNNVGIFGICFSHCSNYIYSGDEYGVLKKWNINIGSVIVEKKVFSGSIWRVKFSPNDKHLLICCDDRNVKLIMDSSNNFSVIRTFIHDEIIGCVEFHPTQRIIAVGDISNKAILWNMDAGALIHTFHMGGKVWDVHFLNPNILLVLSGDGYITSYNMYGFQEIQKVLCDCKRKGASSFAFSPDRRNLACGKCDDYLKIYSIVFEFCCSDQTSLIELSKNGRNVLSNLFSVCIDSQMIRQLVSAGVCMNEEEYKMVVDACWDLVDINTNNGGNMYSFMNLQSDASDEDDDV
eukprot:TRINITY_DN3058_c1_g12_i1.p1 TRINITY_DN3058_c1_g12~~TRINITY_DN3058_c1_g12_i1.p1  ORF type:complete len:402 (-),score=98.35 TRINITY_DN3058_c1_g12_i1:331-1536(-)